MRKNKNSALWPKIDSYEASLSAMRQGCWGLSITALLTACILAANIATNKNYQSINIYSIFDITIMCIVAFYIYFGSRKAVYLGCFYYILNLSISIKENLQAPGLVAIFVLLMMVNSLRGTIKLKEFIAPDITTIEPPTPKWLNVTFMILGYCLVLVIALVFCRIRCIKENL